MTGAGLDVLHVHVLLPLGAGICGLLLHLAADPRTPHATRILAALAAAGYVALASRTIAGLFREAWA